MSLYSDVAFGRTTKLDQAELNRRMKILTDAIETLRLFAPDWQEQVDALRAVGLERIDDALMPIYERIMEVAHLGTIFSASSASIEEFGLGIKRFVIPEQQRPNFAPSRFLLIMVEGGSFDAIMLGRLSSYDRETGELAVLVDNSTGEGMHDDWIIGPYATSDGLEDLRVEVNAAMVAAVSARDTATQQTGFAAGHAATATSQAAIAATHAATASTKASEATGQAVRAETAAAALIGLASDEVSLTAFEPTLDFDFTATEGFTGAFARASGASGGSGGYILNEKGVLVPDIAGTPSLEFDARTRLVKGLSLFGSTYNRILRGVDMEASAWSTANGARSVASSILLPVGNIGNATYLADSGAGEHYHRQEVGTSGQPVPLTQVWAASVFLKPVGRNHFRIRVSSTTGLGSAHVDVNFSGSTPSVAMAVSGGFNPTLSHASIKPYLGGWYRVEFSFYGAGMNGYFDLVSSTSPGGINFDAAGVTGYVLVWGAQMSQGTLGAGPVILNAGELVPSRDAEGLEISGADFSPSFNVSEFTIYTDYQLPGVIGTSFPRVIWALLNNADANSLLAATLEAVSQMPRIQSGSSWGAAIAADPGPQAADQSVRLAVSYKDGEGIRMVRNGGAAKADPTVTTATVNKLQIGHTDVSANYSRLNGYLKRLAVWPKALPDIDLQRITA